MGSQMVAYWPTLLANLMIAPGKKVRNQLLRPFHIAEFSDNRLDHGVFDLCGIGRNRTISTRLEIKKAFCSHVWQSGLFSHHKIILFFILSLYSDFIAFCRLIHKLFLFLCSHPCCFFNLKPFLAPSPHEHLIYPFLFRPYSVVLELHSTVSIQGCCRYKSPVNN